MSFTDHKITQFQHRIVDLPDQPTLPPDELKARFDSSAEELRVALGAVCDDANALETRVDGHDAQINQISMEKFPDDTIQEKNLHPDLASKLNGKADQTALESETDARAALDTRVGTLESALPQKCEICCGTYTGDGTNTAAGGVHLTFPFSPKLVIIQPLDVTYMGPIAYLILQSPRTESYVDHTNYVICQEWGQNTLHFYPQTDFSSVTAFNEEDCIYGYIAIG